MNKVKLIKFALGLAVLVCLGFAGYSLAEEEMLGIRTADSGWQKEGGYSVIDTDVTAAVPDTNGGADLGTASLYWNNAYINNLTAVTTSISSAVSGTLKVGNCATSHALTGSGDLVVCDALEVDGLTYLDTTTTIKDALVVTNPTGTVSTTIYSDGTNSQIKSSGSLVYTAPGHGFQTGAVTWNTNGLYSSANTSYIGLGGITATDTFITYDETTAQTGVFLGSASGRQLVIGEATYNVYNGAYDYDHAVQSNPTLYLQSANNPSVDNRQWVKWYNDGSNSYHLTGIGGHRFGFEAIQANAIITFTANPTTDSGVVFTVNTGTLTGKTSGAGANEFNFGATLSATLDNLVTAWNLIAGTGVVAHKVGNTVVFEASATGTDANAYVTTETTDTDGVYNFQSTLRFTAVPTTNLGVVFTVGTGTLTGVTGAPGANQFQIASTLTETMDNIVRAYNALAVGVTAIRIGDDIYFDGGTSGVSVFTETTDTDNVYSFVATTMTGGRAFSAFMDMQPTYMKLTKQNTASAATTTYSSQYFGLMASGWDTDDTVARDVEFRMQTNGNSGTTPTGTFVVSHWRAGTLTVNAMSMNSAGTVTFAGNVNSTNGTFGTTATNLGLTVKGNDADDANAIGVTLDNGVTLATPGGKLVSIKNNTVEKAYFDYLGNFYAAANKALIIGVEDQSDLANTAGVGLSILADDGGGLAAGVANGGAITITAGDAGGSTGNGNGGIISLAGGAKVNSGTSGYVRIGNGAPTYLIASFDQESLYVDGFLEVNNSARFNSTVTFTNSGRGDNYQDLFGSGNDAVILYSSVQTPDSWLFGVSADSRTMMVIEKADTATDFALALQTNPTIAIQSSDATKTYEGALYTYNGITMRTVGAVATTGTNLMFVGQDAGTSGIGGPGGSILLTAGKANGTGNNVGGGIVLNTGAPSGLGNIGSIILQASSTNFGMIAPFGTSLTSPAFYGFDVDGTSPVGVVVGSFNNLTDASARMLSVKNNIMGMGGTEVGYFSSSTVAQVSAATSTLSLTTVSASQGSCLVLDDASGTGTTYCTVEDGTMTCSTIPCN